MKGFSGNVVGLWLLVLVAVSCWLLAIGQKPSAKS